MSEDGAAAGRAGGALSPMGAPWDMGGCSHRGVWQGWWWHLCQVTGNSCVLSFVLPLCISDGHAVG